METVSMDAEIRTTQGKGSSRKIRQLNKVPGIIYGSSSEPVQITVDALKFENLTHRGGGHQIISINLDNKGKKSKQIAVIKEVQRHPYKGHALHVDFLKIALNEEISATVPIQVVGEAPGQKAGGVMQHGSWEITVKGLATNLPGHVEIDVSSLEVGDAFRAEDIKLPSGLELMSHADDIIVSIVPPTKVVEEVLPAEEIAEPELVEKATSEEE